MSQSSVGEQVEELAKAGFPISRGTRGPSRDGRPDAAQYSSDLWMSRWSNNVFRNFPLLMKSYGVRFLCGAAKGMPAFVVGVGPSLDVQVQDLKAAKGRSLIISTDAALRALLANGVVPDLVVSFDCKDDQKRLWEGVTQPIPCLFNSCTHPDSIASWPGPVMFFNQYHTADDLCHTILPTVLPHLGQLPSSGTVGNMAVMAAHLLDCDPICVVGMDFCYAPTNQGGWQYRAQDYKWEKADGFHDDRWVPTEIKELYDNAERVDRSFMLDDGAGNQFRSDPELKFYFESFRDLMPHFKIPIVNCSPTGLIPERVMWKMPDGSSVEHEYERLSVSAAVEKFCPVAFQEGRTIVSHLGRVAPDPRRNMENPS